MNTFDHLPHYVENATTTAERWPRLDALLRDQHGVGLRSERPFYRVATPWAIPDRESGKNSWLHILSEDGRVFTDRLFPILEEVFDGKKWKEGEYKP